MLRKVIVVFAAVIVFAGATLVNQCGTETPYSGSEQITVSGCEKPVCELEQGTTYSIEIKFVPNKTIQSLTNKVQAELLNLPVPFVGVDGTNACDNIYKNDTKVSCPLEKDVEYTYRNSFPILSIYPRVPLIVQYALQEGNEKLICFKVPAKITKKTV